MPPQRPPTPEVAAKRSEGMLAADALRTLAFAHRQARNDCQAAADTADLYGARSGCRRVESLASHCHQGQYTALHCRCCQDGLRRQLDICGRQQ